MTPAVLTAAPPRRLEVQIAPTPEGGWDVSATVDGRTVQTRHCNEWHRAERTRRLMQLRLGRGVKP